MGTDTLDGGAGADTVQFSLGDGADTITAAGDDTLLFGEGITPEMVEFTKGSSTTMVLRIAGTADQITFNQWSSGDTYKPGTIRFADGTVWALADIKARPVVITGTEAANSLSGLAGSVNLISGLGGNDTLNGQALGDTLDGGAGNDTLSGLAGNDTLIGGAGTTSSTAATATTSSPAVQGRTPSTAARGPTRTGSPGTTGPTPSPPEAMTSSSSARVLRLPMWYSPRAADRTWS